MVSNTTLRFTQEILVRCAGGLNAMAGGVLGVVHHLLRFESVVAGVRRILSEPFECLRKSALAFCSRAPTNPHPQACHRHNVAPRWGYGSGYLQGSQNAPHPSLRDAVLPLRPNASSRGLQTCDLQARKPIVPESGYGRPRRAGAAASLPPGTLILYVEQRDATMLYDVERAGYRQLNALLDIDRRSGQAAVHCEGSVTEGPTR